jgi:hypothetical protein
MHTIHPKQICSQLLAALLAIAVAAPAPAQSCVGDLNGDGVINGEDLGQLLGAWGRADHARLTSTLTAWWMAKISGSSLQSGVSASRFLRGNGGGSAARSPAGDGPALRAALIATGRPWRVRDTSTQIEMPWILPGYRGAQRLTSILRLNHERKLN